MPADKDSTAKAHRPLAGGLIVLFRVEITGGHLWPRREPLCLLCGWSQHDSQRLSLRNVRDGKHFVTDQQGRVAMREQKFGVPDDGNQDAVGRETKLLQCLADHR